MSKTTKDTTLAEYTARLYGEKVDEIVAKLRDVANRFELNARPYDSPGIRGCPRHTEAAQEALHSLTWDLANVHAERLIGVAGEADAAEREETP